MNDREIVQHAQELGVSLVLQGDRILYTPKSRTPIEFVAALREHKQELLRYLSQQKDDAFRVSAQNPRNPGKPDFQERVENPETHHLLTWASELAEQDVALPRYRQ
jgi:hypothetical protein